MFRDRLSASDMLSMKKVMEHVWEKMLHAPPQQDTYYTGATQDTQAIQPPPPLPANIEQVIQLYCNDQVWVYTVIPGQLSIFYFIPCCDNLIYIEEIYFSASGCKFGSANGEALHLEVSRWSRAALQTGQIKLTCLLLLKLWLQVENWKPMRLCQYAIPVVVLLSHVYYWKKVFIWIVLYIHIVCKHCCAVCVSIIIHSHSCTVISVGKIKYQYASLSCFV